MCAQIILIGNKMTQNNKVFVLFDLTQLYFTSRRIDLLIDYKELLGEIKYLLDLEALPSESVVAVGFTTALDSNKPQQNFIKRLAQSGYEVIQYPPTKETKDSYLTEMLAYALANDASEVALVTNVEAAANAQKILKDAGKDCAIVYFGEDVPTSWAQLILKRSLDFTDLSDQVTKDRIALSPENAKLEEAP